MPGATGKLVVTWTIEPDGHVASVRLVSLEFASTPMATCVIERIKRWRFPAHPYPSVPVTFPFKF
jgi:outer membrane biosynthesis protein TonB